MYAEFPGCQATTIAVSYIALSKSEGSADFAERLSELIAQYKGSRQLHITC